MHILQAKNLTKRFGKFLAVDDVSLSLKEGEILGLLGPNGAGKTTTIQMILGILTPSAGEVFYFGKNLSSHREEILEQVNFSSTYTNLPWDLTVRECLSFVSYLYVIDDRQARVKKISELFLLDQILDKKISQLSAGQITRVDVAKSFINFPKVLLLDEPTASLDPDVADYIRKFLLEDRQKFKTSIIFTSHNMAEVEEVCDRVVFINHGKIVADDTPENLAKTIKTAHVQLLSLKNLDRIIEYCNKVNLENKIEGKRITITTSEKQIPSLLQDLSSQNLGFEEISIEKPSLEDYFLEQAKGFNRASKKSVTSP
ncbi:MAG: ABC transporter ATP-binding protein [Patescibacteria group bacterium]